MTKTFRANLVKHNRSEKLDPTPLRSTVAFKRPLSAHERVMQAIRQHESLRRLESEPGDESFDTNIDEILTPHQLVTDEETGQELTAGERIMLQHERQQAKIDVANEVNRRKSAKLTKPKEKTAPKKPAAKAAIDSSEEESDEVE